MEDPSAEPGRELSAAELAERLKKLEAESAALRAALESAGQATSPEVPLPSPPPNQSLGEGTGEAPQPDAPDPQPEPPENLEAAEQALARWRLEQTRGNKEFAAKYLAEAVTAAPHSALVLEVQGDDALARRQNKQALEFYKLAMEKAPGNTAVEKKHADLAFKALAQSAALDSMMGEFESLASARSATMFSVFLPGLGQIVIGEWAKGIVFILLWVGCIIWVIMVAPTIGSIQGSNFNPIALAPIVAALVIWIAAITDLSTKAKVLEKRRLMNQKARIPPPENLPYE